MAAIQMIVGALGMGDANDPNTPIAKQSTVGELLPKLKQYHIDTLDTAQLYGESEAILGALNAGNDFIIDTKWPGGFSPGTATKDGIIAGANKSIEALKVKQVNIFWIHGPDPTIPIEDTLTGVNEVYKRGLFKRFGLSNFSIKDVEKIHAISKDKGYPLPTVYQGNYSAVARDAEAELLPTLRRLGMSFYAFSATAGGFLTKTAEDVEKGAGRFDPTNWMGAIYHALFAKPSLIKALRQWASIAEEAGATKAELAYRWVRFNSPLKPEYGDAVLLGGRTADHYIGTLEGLQKGPLPADIAKKIDDVWETVKHEAPRYDSRR